MEEPLDQCDKPIVDEMTGGYTEAYLYERGSEEIERARRYGGGLSLLLMNIDGLVDICSTSGEEAATETLLRAVESIRTRIRTTDLLFRFQDDQLAIVLVETPCESALKPSNEIVERVAACDLSDVTDVTVRVHGAVLGFPEDGQDLDELITKAQTVLSRVAGRDGTLVERA